MRIAKKKITDLLRDKGKKPSDYEPSAITAAAKARVEEEKKLASEGLDSLLSDLVAKPAEAAE